MNLSIRLQKAFDLLRQDMVLADIGCDHGFLAIEYAKKYQSKVYAIDNKKMPLNSAKENIKKANVTSFVIPVLSNGLEKINDDVKQLSILGMGGNNIIDILQEDKLKNIEYMVLQANNNVPSLRRYLNKINYQIISEELIEENDVIYEMLCVKKGKEALTEKQYYFGPYIMQNKGELFTKKYASHLAYLNDTLNKIPLSYKENRQRLIDEIEMIRSEL